MSVWFWILATYFTLDLAVLIYYAGTGRVIRVTAGSLALAFVTHILFIIVAVTAATKGVTP